ARAAQAARLVLVDEAAEHVDALDSANGCQSGHWCGRGYRHLKVDAPVWSARVVVLDVRVITLCRWSRFQISVQSRHSARTVRTHRSAYAFAFGARGGVTTASIPAAANTASNAAVNLLSRSRIRNRNPSTRSSRSITRFRAAWATHWPVGCAVIPARWTRRPCSSTTNSTYSRLSPTVSTVKKSQASMPTA